MGRRAPDAATDFEMLIGINALPCRCRKMELGNKRLIAQMKGRIEPPAPLARFAL